MVGQFSLIAVLAVITVAQARTLDLAKAGEFPYQVSLREYNVHVCSGAIFAYRHILTTANCVFKYNRYRPNFFVVTGSLSSSSNDGEVHMPLSVTTHPQYTKNTIGPNNIAIIALDKPIRFNYYQKQIYLPLDYTPIGTPLTVTGWRWANRGPSDSEDLMKLSVRTVACSQSLFAGFKEICASVVSGREDCFPDFGCPLVGEASPNSGGKLIGILTYATACNVKKNFGFVNIVYHMEWIYRTTLRT